MILLGNLLTGYKICSKVLIPGNTWKGHVLVSVLKEPERRLLAPSREPNPEDVSEKEAHRPVIWQRFVDLFEQKEVGRAVVDEGVVERWRER